MKLGAKLSIGSKILRAKLTGALRPFFVQYSLLNGCNASCTYCNSPQRADPQLSTQQHLELLKQFSELGTVRIKFLGGEPLLRNDIGELVRYCNALGVRSAMVTNGFLVPKKFDVIRELDELIISIDGREEAHDRQRGTGSWKLVMRAISQCTEAKIDFFLSAVVTKESTSEIDWLIDLATKAGVKVNFQIPQYNPEMYGIGARQHLPQPEEIRRVLEKIIAAKDAGAPILFSTKSYRHTLNWEDFGKERVVTEEPSRCSAGKYFLQMEPNGDIYPCVLHVGSFSPKNAVQVGVREAWEHAQEHSCSNCYNTWLNENKAIFNLEPAVLFNFWKNYLPASSRIN